MAHLNKDGQIILTEDDKEALKGTRGVADRIMEKIIWGNKTPIYKTNNKNNEIPSQEHNASTVEGDELF